VPRVLPLLAVDAGVVLECSEGVVAQELGHDAVAVRHYRRALEVVLVGKGEGGGSRANGLCGRNGNPVREDVLEGAGAGRIEVDRGEGRQLSCKRAADSLV
jgi:hypothetical protein